MAAGKRRDLRGRRKNGGNIVDVSIVLGLLGGLALFLYGMQMMSSGLEAAAGNRMKRILEKLTANRFLGVLVGAGITAVIQSSSATTVMVVGFVNSGMMTLRQAVWIIMGANIGTTITGQLIALDIGQLAPLFAFVGVAMVVFFKKPQIHHYGNILAGLGVLFIGMEMMSSSMEPLREWPAFVEMVSTFSNPLVGIAAGTLFTAVIQSSSASVGILQAMAAGGIVGLDSAVYVLFGQNIGTCITAVLASFGTSRNAKRTTIIHLMFNLFGTVLFTIICMTTPLTDLVASFTPGSPDSQIANMHTLFNIVTTLILLPFGTLLVKVAMRILPDRNENEKEGMHLAYLVPGPALTRQEHPIGFSAMYVNQLRQEISRMLGMARQNVDLAFEAVLAVDPRRLEQAEETEEYIDFLNKEICRYISDVIVNETNEKDSAAVSAYYLISGNIERIGDHAMNICEYTQLLKRKNIHFSEDARAELRKMQNVCLEAIDILETEPGVDVDRWLERAASFEQKIDDMTGEFRDSQLDRMRRGTCSDEGGIIFSELLTDFERIGDHVLNIAEQRAAAATASV
ncbi:MAG TPA: Na/Pi cotransporter family protein [Candidatus Caccousia avicola]|uniref:Na/Pi cotransporter family protein n=1 Tax=Candidatus Caccousia avicola TaxID=2840721 RepID=A0A9D1ALH6_9FIRM|nr:Na/Pi cotransporter family protein [Candidatus Caccousia avicola]